MKKPRIALYEPWGGNIDEGWTRWILEQFHFPFTVLHNADVQDGHLRDQFDTIVIAEMGTRQIMDGMPPGTVPGQYAGGIGDSGARRPARLRHAGRHAGDFRQRHPVRHRSVQPAASPTWWRGCADDQFFCSGSLLRVEIKEPNHPVVAGLPLTLPVMFERNPVFDTKPAFRGKVLASYVKDRNPLLSGFLLGADLHPGQGGGARCQLRQRATSSCSASGRSGAASRTAPTSSSSTRCSYNPSMAPEARPAGGGRGGRGGGVAATRSVPPGGARPKP